MEELTVPQLLAFRNYFEEHPPLHMMVAAFAGVKRARSVNEQSTNPATMQVLESLLANSVSQVRR